MAYEVHSLVAGTLIFPHKREPVHVWLINGNGRAILVDAGQPVPEVVRERWRTGSDRGGPEPIVEELRACGLEPGEIDTVVLTHLHFDHAWNIDLFPNAQVVVQRSEVIHAIDPTPTQRGIYNQQLNAALIQRKRPGQLLIIDGDHRLAPGIDLLLLPGHTPGTMGVVVETTAGKVGISSDAAETYANWFPADPVANPDPVRFLADTTLPPHISTESVAICIASQKRLRMASDIVIPSHDWRIPRHVPAQWWDRPAMAAQAENPVAGKTVPQVLAATVAAYPDREALVCQYDGTRWTYRQLKAEVDRLARGLWQLGVRRRDRVCIWLPNYKEWIVTKLAALTVGAVVVPVNARYRAPEVDHLLKMAEPKVLVMTERFLSNRYQEIITELVPELSQPRAGELQAAAYPSLRHVVSVGTVLPGTISYAELQALGDEPGAEAAVADAFTNGRPEDWAFLFFTSGTTSAPKGVLHNHTLVENVWNWGQVVGYSENDRVLINRPLFYIAGMLWGCMIAMVHGACMVPCLQFTPEEILENIDRHGVTTMSGTPNLWSAVLNHPDRAKYDLSSLRMGSVGGGSPGITLVEQMIAAGLKPVQIYGLTETHGYTTSTRLDDPPEVIAHTLGRPLPGFAFKLVDPETLEPVAPGQPGEALVRGRLLVTYYQMPADLLAQFFTPDGWYRTGDLLRQDEQGNFIFVGRTKDMIKVGGENLSSLEVENVLRLHPAVLETAVFGVPDQARLEVVAAYVQLRPGMQATEEELVRWCRSRIATFKVPRYMRFVSDSREWPLTPSSKIQKHILRDRLIADLPAARSAGTGPPH